LANQPTKIGKYDVIRVIGRGGMGTVYQAVDPTIGRMVAIKKVTSVLSDEPELLKRFYREAQSTGKLQHPNIVTLHDLGEQDGVPYLVMEYLEGDSLDKIIRERRLFTVAEKLNIMIQVCEGLAYAHQRQIVHRDIKPGNIVVLNDGGVKIVDFGIAQFGAERYTRTGQVVGSLYYMSPEQIQDADIDSRCDVYSTGIVLFEFLSGSLPFQGKDPTATLAKILHQPPPSLASVLGDQAADLDGIIRNALAKDRNLRYASMEDFAFDLRSLEEKLSRDLIESSLRNAESSMAGKDWEKAREHLRHVLKLDKQHRRANEWLREVQTQIHKQQVSDQIHQLRSRADEALAVRNWEEALGLLDQAVKIDGTNSELLQFRESVRRSSALLAEALRRAESAHNAGDLDGAKTAVEEALGVDPSNTTAKALNAILAKEISERSKRKKIDDLVTGARKEMALRHFTSALELLQVASSIDSSVTEVQQLIRSASAGQEHERRRQALEKACAVIEELLNRDQYADACAKADEALQSFPQDLGLLKLKAFAEKQREAWGRRLYIESQVATARQLLDGGELNRAQNILNDALERYPDDSGVMSLLGMVGDAIAREEAQRREAERQANERRRYIRFQLDAAASLQQAGQTTQALKKIQEGLIHYPDSEELKIQVSSLQDLLAREEAQRKRAEEEARQKKAEIEKSIADSWQLLSKQQTRQAVELLEQAFRRYSDSADLQAQLEFARRRLAAENAERERLEQEARRRKAEIQKEIAGAQALLNGQQTDRAINALADAIGRYPESEEMKSLLQVAQRRQEAERAQQAQADKELRAKRSEIEKLVLAARQLLDAGRTADSIERLEQALRRYPESEELKSFLARTQQRLAAEIAERKKAEEEERRKRAWIDAEITNTQQWIEGNQADRAVTSLREAVRLYPENEALKSHLELAQQRLVQEQAEREQAEREAQLRQAEIAQEISSAQKFLDSGKIEHAMALLDKAVRKFPESKELRAQLDVVRNRFAEEAAEKRRIEEQARRRREEIEQETAAAQRLLATNQTDGAVAALANLYRRYPDSNEVKAQLDAAHQRQAAETAERERIAQERLRKQKEVENAIQAARILLNSGQTAQAIASLEQSLRRLPDSEELKLELQRSRQRAAEEEAEKQRAEQERQRRAAEISNALASARKLLDSAQTPRAVAALEQAARSYPENDELRSLLASAQKRLAQERAEQEKAAREAQERRQKIAAEAENANRLLKASKTAEALAILEQAVVRYPESEELRSLLAAGKAQREREAAAREQAEKRREQLQAAVANIRQLLNNGEPERAVAACEAALQSFGKEDSLQTLLANAKSAAKIKKTEDKKRAAEREQAEEQKRQRERDLASLRKLIDPIPTKVKAAALEKLRSKARDIAARYPRDAEFQQSLAEIDHVVQSLIAEAQEPPSAPPETGSATQVFKTEPVERPATVRPPVDTRPKLPIAPARQLPRFLNKWMAIGVVGVIAVGVLVKYFFPPSPQPKPVKFTVSLASQPPGAAVQVGDQTCDKTPCTVELPAGSYNIQAHLKGYFPTEQSLVINPEQPNPSITLSLQPEITPENGGYLVVHAGVEGADVLINGRSYDQTLPGGTVRIPLDPGSYKVEVQKKDYERVNPLTVQIRKGQDTSVDFHVTALPTFAELSIVGAKPHAEVQIDGRHFGTTSDDGGFLQPIDPGKHEILLAQDGQRSKPIQRTFEKGKRTDIDGKEFVIPPAPAPAMVEVEVINLPPGATVNVDGTQHEREASGTAHFKATPHDKHAIEISAPSYKPQKLELSFPPHAPNIDGTLERMDVEGPAWAQVENSTDMANLQDFLNAYPNGKHAHDAESKLDQLIDGNSSAQQLRTFHDQYPGTAAGKRAGARADKLLADSLRNEQDRQATLAISQVLQQYKSAYERRDFNALRAVYPTVRPTVQKMFDGARAVTITLDPREAPSINGDQASMKVQQEITLTNKDGSQPTVKTPILSWKFARQNGNWIIQQGP
jgi:eukaryotic-like serine/threonine-protein kinase